MEKESALTGTLYVVATPIGNLQDISERAIAVLKTVELVAAEDTRHSARLLDSLGISKRVVSFHDFSSGGRLRALLDSLLNRQSIALISDAGTPGISDPGYELVRQARIEGIDVVPIPGPSAVIAALSVSGLPSDRFIFEGFLPARSQARKSHLAALRDETRTMIFYESPHRIRECLADLGEIMGPDRELFIGRELTKKFETTRLARIETCQDWLARDPVQQKGEFVLVLAGNPKAQRKELALREGLRVLALLSAELPLNRAAKLAAEISGAPRNALYRSALQEQQGHSDEDS